MRSRVVWLIAALLVGFLATAPGYAQVGENMLPNGGFESGEISPYGVYDDDDDGEATAEVVTDCEGAGVPEGPAEGNYCLHVVVPPPGLEENDWDVGMADNSYTFKKGKRYVFSCFMKCKSGKLKVRMKPERGEEPFEAYNEREVTINTTWKKYSVTTPIMTERVTPASPTFHFNFAAGDFWIDDVRLYEVQDEGATYTWTGAAGDLQWKSPGNWESSASIYNWPNEEFGFPRVNQDAGEIIIGNGDMVTCSGKLEIRSGAHGSGEACLIIENGSGLGKLTTMFIGCNGSSGRAEVHGGALEVGELLVGLQSYSTGKLEIKSGTVDVGMVFAVAVMTESAGVVEIKGGTLNSSGDLWLAVDGDSAAMSIKGGEVNIAGHFQMNYSTGLLSELVMDGGVVNVAYGTYLNWGAGIDSQADFTLNGGTWNSGKLCVGATTNGGNACLTINGGTMVSSGNLVVGNQSSGESRIILNGGLLQAGDLIIDTSTDSLIVYRGGELWVNKTAMGEAAMQDLITAGLIDATADYEITTVGDYTVLRSSGM